MLKLKRRQGQSSPVTTIRAVLRKETQQEPRHFETGVENNLQSKPGPRVGSRGVAGVAARGRGPEQERRQGLCARRSCPGGAAPPGSAEQSAAEPGAKVRGPEAGRRVRRRPGLAYLKRPPGSPPLPGRPRRRPPSVGGLRGSSSPAPQPRADPTSAAVPTAPPPPVASGSGNSRTRSASGREAPGRAERSPWAGRNSAPPPDGSQGLWPAGAEDMDGRRITARFWSQVFKVRDRKNK